MEINSTGVRMALMVLFKHPYQNKTIETVGDLIDYESAWLDFLKICESGTLDQEKNRTWKKLKESYKWLNIESSAIHFASNRIIKKEETLEKYRNMTGQNLNFSTPYDQVNWKIISDVNEILQQEFQHDLFNTDIILPILPSLNSECPPFLFVDYEDPQPIKDGLMTIAKYFRREFNYETLMYVSIEPYKKSEYRPFALSINNKIIGGGGFRWRTKTEYHHPTWALQWIWIHPYQRNKGIWKKIEVGFRSKFGDFFIEPPLSAPMKNYILEYRKDLIENEKVKEYLFKKVH